MRAVPTARMGMNTRQRTPILARLVAGNVEPAGRKGRIVKIRTKWVCPRCGASVTTYVPLTVTPTHPCSRKANKTVPLEKEQGE